jgi:hypothetical protein
MRRDLELSDERVSARRCAMKSSREEFTMQDGEMEMMMGKNKEFKCVASSSSSSIIFVSRLDIGMCER